MLIGNRLAIFLAAFLTLSLGCSDKQPKNSPQGSDSRVGSGVTPYEGIEPDLLFLGNKIGDMAQKCVRAVVISDVELACRNNQCNIQAFHLPVQPVSHGQRALHVIPCNTNPELVKGDLLTDRSPDYSTAILYFQAHRSGNLLWKQLLTESGQYQIEFPTEATVGTLRLDEQGRYVWEEQLD